jgi:hypothetical protein
LVDQAEAAKLEAAAFQAYQQALANLGRDTVVQQDPFDALLAEKRNQAMRE